MDEVLTGLIVITYYAFCGFLGWTLAERKGRGPIKWMMICILLQFVGVIILMLMPRLNKVASGDTKVAQNLTYQQFTSLPGFGKKKAMAIVQRFPTKDDIKSASIEDITAIPGISKNLAKIVKDNID